MTTVPVGANKFADSGFLIDLFLSGGQKALDAFRDKLAGKIIITIDAIAELGQFTTSNIDALKTWVQSSANVTTINYTDTELAAARAAKRAAIDAGVTELSAFDAAIKQASKNAVQAG